MISYSKTVGTVINAVVASIALSVVLLSVFRLKVHLGTVNNTKNVALVFYIFAICRLGLDYGRMGVCFGYSFTVFIAMPSSSSDNNSINDIRCGVPIDELLFKSMAYNRTLLFSVILCTWNCTGYVFVDS